MVSRPGSVASSELLLLRELLNTFFVRGVVPKIVAHHGRSSSNVGRPSHAIACEQLVALQPCPPADNQHCTIAGHNGRPASDRRSSHSERVGSEDGNAGSLIPLRKSLKSLDLEEQSSTPVWLFYDFGVDFSNFIWISRRKSSWYKTKSQ
jgi:hypothetical protein